jgi:CheY-like chemotaxis protein
MPDGGRLTIETANAELDERYAQSQAEVEPGQYVLICVSDSGTGMPPDVAERAFDPFYTTKGVGRGTGLGLSQVYGYAKQSRGHVKIYSEMGHGTTVRLYLPRHLGQAPVPGEEPLVSAPLPQGIPDKVVLVVEDEDEVRRMTVEALRELGYGVIEAKDAAQAIELLDTHPRVDLLFTDIVMPGMNGRELSERIRQIDPAIRTLFTTGYTRNAIVHQGVLDAGVAFLPKPFTIQRLADKVREALEASVEPAGDTPRIKPIA